jgi:hypothetical protein
VVAFATTRRGHVRWALVALGLAPLFAGVVIAIRQLRRSEARLVTEYVAHALGDAPLLSQLASPGARRSLRALAHARAGAPGRHAAASFEHTATELAFLQRRLESGWARVDARHEARRAELRHGLEKRFARLQALHVVS